MYGFAGFVHTLLQFGFAVALAAHLTLQDRLVKEMRLRGISTVADANAYAPSFIAMYNSRFAKRPRSDFNAHRPLRSDDDLDLLLTWRETRRGIGRGYIGTSRCGNTRMGASRSEQPVRYWQPSPMTGWRRSIKVRSSTTNG